MYYFAYGINLDEAELLLKCPEARFVGTGILENFHFIINQHGDATLIRDDDSIVYGTVWEISDAEAKTLDEYENVPENLAVRETVPVILGRITLQDVLIHTAVDSTPGSAEENYMKKIISAAEEYGISEDYIAYLKSLKTE